MIDRYEILCYLGYDPNGPYATHDESKSDDGKFVLFADYQREIDELLSIIDYLEAKIELDAP